MKGIIYEDENKWQMNGATDVEQYFRRLRENFKKLELVPTVGEMLEESTDDSEVMEYGDIYRQFGWSGESYRKEEALAAVAQHKRRRDGEVLY